MATARAWIQIFFCGANVAIVEMLRAVTWKEQGSNTAGWEVRKYRLASDLRKFVSQVLTHSLRINYAARAYIAYILQGTRANDFVAKGDCGGKRQS